MTATTIAQTRERFVLENANFFTLSMRDEFLGPDGIKDFEAFARGIEGRAREASREYTTFLNDRFKDDVGKREQALTSHADHARSILSNIAQFKVHVASLKIAPDNRPKRLEAGRIMGYLRAQCEAMENLII